MNIRVPVSWLRDYLKTDLAAKTIANYLTQSGPSVDKVTKYDKDYVFEVEITSNRVDTYSVFGLCREAQAILTYENQKSQLVQPSGLDTSLDPDTKNLLPLDVVIKNRSLCQRFTAIVIDNVKVGPSPAFIKNRLSACGIRPINNIVDITNYIMLELGQPMHTYDYDKVKRARMIMRASVEGEKVITLDNQIRKPPKGSIVIEDGEQRLIDLCGIMGAANTQITKRTKRVILYAQSYDPARIKKTTQDLSFRTEAASIFEKGVDIEAIPKALARSAYLAKKYARAKIASELVDIVNVKPQARKITLNLKKLASYLGLEIDHEKAAKILKSLGFNITKNETTIIAQPPSWRRGDVQIEEDLIEEIARIYGYSQLPSKLPAGQIPQTEESDLEKVISLKSSLKDLGLTEIISYSIISQDFLGLTGDKNPVELSNPLTEEWQFMRPTILVSLVDAISKNQYLKSNIKLFEVAKTYISSPRHSELSEESQLPKQDLHLAIVLQNSGFYQIKGFIENVFELLNQEPEFENLTKPHPLFENGQSANIQISQGNAKPRGAIGALGIIRRSILDFFEIKEPVAACELNLSTIYNLPSNIKSYRPIPKYPPVFEDISAIFAKTTPIGEITTQVQKVGSPLLKTVEVLDIFETERIGRDKKSVTLHLTYQKSDSTPTHEEVAQVREKMIAHIEKSLKAQVRR